MGPCSLLSAAGRWSFYDGRLHLDKLFRIHKYVTSFLFKEEFTIIPVCFSPSPSLKDIGICFCPSGSPIIFIQIPMHNYCSCFQKSQVCLQGGPRRLFFSKKSFLNAHLWYLLQHQQQQVGFCLLHSRTLTETKPDVPKDRKKTQMAIPTPSHTGYVSYLLNVSTMT